jgi:HD-GYP domain-containing protein (c-di-GMP phosphodiesterase class II)
MSGTRPLLIASSAWADANAPLLAAPLFAGLAAEVRRTPELPNAAELDPCRPTVVIVDRALLSGPRAAGRLPALAEVAALVGVGESWDSEPGPSEELLAAVVVGGTAPRVAAAQLRGAMRHATSLAAGRVARTREAERRDDLAELTRVGVALSTERDLLALLELIVSQARSLTSSDAASLYLVEPPERSKAERRAAVGTLRFKLSQNFTLPDLPLSEFTVPIDHASLAGHAAATGEPLVIADVALLPEGTAYRPNRSFDERFGYRTKSVLVIPMKTHRDEVVGVLQLINRKRTSDARLDTPEATEREVLPFDERAIAVVSALAAQAAVAIENSLLYDSIERLFEGFVTASVTAIDARDPATCGHSARVAALAVTLAERLDRVGEYAPERDAVRFSRAQLRELRYAALLHDFGKVAVREQVLVKQKKLYPAGLDAVRRRFEYAMQAADLAFERERADFLLAFGPARYSEAVEELERTRRRRRAELAGYLEAVLAANEPTVLTEATSDELQRIAEATYVDHGGSRRPLLTPDEVRALSIRRGNLDEFERREIESHVQHTYRFLQEIPWTRELERVPDIALAHHEKLNGTGYPNALCGPEVSLEARIVAIADIFDALTAADRPYRRAMSPEYALGIIRSEAAAGALDADLVEVFAAARPWEALAPEDRAAPRPDRGTPRDNARLPVPA